MPEELTDAETRYCRSIASKDSALRALLDARQPGVNPVEMFDYLIAVKNTLGNPSPSCSTWQHRTPP
jgi:hypothetical protein